MGGRYFTTERYELERFSDAVAQYQSFSVGVQASLSALNVVQQLILNGCLGAAYALAAVAVQRGGMGLGGFVAVGAWVVGTFTPLNFLGTVYNAIIQALSHLL